MEPRQLLDFDAVYAEHAAYVRRMLVHRGVRASDLDDVLQEVFMTVHGLLPSFEGRSSVETWLCSVTWRVVANYHRRVRGRSEVGLETQPSVVDSSEAPLGSDGARAVLGAVDERLRDLIALHHVGGFSISELSELTGNARATIRKRLDRGRAAIGRRIWNALTEHDQEAWLARLAESFTQPPAPAALPLARPIVCGKTAISTLDDIVLAVWRGPSSVEASEALINVMLAISEANPAGFRYFSVVEPTSSPPSPRARNIQAWLSGTLGNKAIALACAIESSSLMRLVAPVVSSCLFLGGVPVDLRLFDSVTPAASWLSQYGAADAARIATEIAALRQCLDEVHPR